MSDVFTNHDFSTPPETSFSGEAFDVPRRRYGMIAVMLTAALVSGGGLWWLTQDDGYLQDPSTAETISEETTATTTKAETTPEPPTFDLAERVHFKVNEAALSAAAKLELDRWVEQLNQDKSTWLQVDGHCDERGTKAYNDRLGYRRASAVKNYLVSQGIARQRIHTASYGKTRPIVDGHSEASWSKNRRVEMRLVTSLSQR